MGKSIQFDDRRLPFSRPVLNTPASADAVGDLWSGPQRKLMAKFGAPDHHFHDGKGPSPG